MFINKENIPRSIAFLYHATLLFFLYGLLCDQVLHCWIIYMISINLPYVVLTMPVHDP